MTKTIKITLLLSLVANLAIFYVGYKALEYRSHINLFLEKYEHVSGEFSSRSEYAEMNPEFASNTIVDNRIVFFGTQVTQKFNLPKFFPEYDVHNRGVEGQRVSGYLLRYKPDVLDLMPKAVVIEISSYNFREYNSIEEIKDYTELLAELAKYNKIEPFLTTVIKPSKEFESVVDDKELGDYNVFDSVDVYNNWLRELCQLNGYVLIDCQNLIGDENGFLAEQFASNLVEPNNEGYAILAKAIKERFESLK